MRAEITVFADIVSKIVPGTEEVLNKYLLMNCEDSMWHCKYSIYNGAWLIQNS